MAEPSSGQRPVLFLSPACNPLFLRIHVAHPNKPMRSIDQAKITADWSDRGFSCDLWTDPPGQRWENFTHANEEIVVVVEREVEFEVEGELYHPKPGEELRIPAGAVHSARNIGDRTARWLYGYKR